MIVRTYDRAYSPTTSPFRRRLAKDRCRTPPTASSPRHTPPRSQNHRPRPRRPTPVVHSRPSYPPTPSFPAGRWVMRRNRCLVGFRPRALGRGPSPAVGARRGRSVKRYTCPHGSIYFIVNSWVVKTTTAFDLCTAPSAIAENYAWETNHGHPLYVQESTRPP